jgi:hypothetical protein
MGIALGIYMLWENKRRDRSQATAGLSFDEHEGQRLSLLDRTEFVSSVSGSACKSAQSIGTVYVYRRTRISVIRW